MQNVSVDTDVVKSPTSNPYLNGGGEMGQLIRSFDWSKTVLGEPETWPQSLLVTVNIIINSRNPMFLWWGQELIQFYNDAYRPSLGVSGKHPKALGQRGEDCWPEIWPVIKPLIDQVLSDQGATWSEDQLIPIFRNNKLEDVYWTFGYSKVPDENGNPAGVLVICTETTGKVITHQKLIESYKKEQILNTQLIESNDRLEKVNEALRINLSQLADSQDKLHYTIDKLEESETRFRQLMLRAPVAMVILSGPDFVIELVNDKALEYWGRAAHRVLNMPLFTALPEARGQGLEKMLQDVLTTGNPCVVNERPVVLERNGQFETTWINFIYEPVRDITGDIDKILVVSTEVTEQVNSRNAIAQAEEKLRHAVASAQLSTWYINAETREFIPSPGLRELFDFYPDEEMPFDHVISLIQDGYRNKVLAAIEQTFLTADPFNMEFPISGCHDKKLRWLKATGKIFHAEGDRPGHFSGTVADITEQHARDMRKYEVLKEQFKEQQKQEIFRVTIKTQEEERKRIAESLHNGIGQLLYAVKLNLSQIDIKDTNTEFVQFRKAKQTTEELLNDAIRESRRISHELTPQFLEDFGLYEAIKAVCKHFNQFMKINCQFKGSTAKLDKYLELSVYRIIQELMLNIFKHAQASQTTVEVEQTSAAIVLVISDNGIGFNPLEMKRKGIGLQGIFNKVKLLNGRYRIENSRGTKVTVIIPINSTNYIK